MKKIVLLVTFLYTLKCSAQSLQKDSLVNYAYQVYGLNDLTVNSSPGKTKINVVERGTGFIINYRKLNYLITNYHVATGKHYIKQKTLDFIKDTTKFIAVDIRANKISDTGIVFKKIILPLYEDGERMFGIFFRTKDTLLDLAVFPLIEYPTDIRLYTISLSNLDTSMVFPENLPLYSLGFAKGNKIKKWMPTIIKTKSMKEPFKEGYQQPDLFMSGKLIQGMSGGPVFVEKEGNKLYLAGVNYASEGDKNKANVSWAVKIKMVTLLIDEMIKEQKPGVSFNYYP